MEQDDQDLSKVKRGKPGTPASIKPKKQQEERTEQIELLKSGEEKMDKLSLPDPANLYSFNYDDNSTKETLTTIIRVLEEKRNLSVNNDPQALQGIIGTFLELASQGSSLAMHNLGLICEEQGKLDLAKKWLTCAFQQSWFTNPLKAHKSPAYEKLKQLNPSILLLYPPVNTPLAQHARCKALLEFYDKNGTAEPYLSPKENAKKRNGLLKKMKSLESKSNFNSLYQAKALALGKFSEANGGYQIAEACYLQFPEHPEALGGLGRLYESGKFAPEKFDQHRDYYHKAATREAFLRLGLSYQREIMGRANKEPNCQEAIKEAIKCFKLSGNKQALAEFGKILVDQKKDYRMAKECFIAANLAKGYLFLAELYKKGVLGSNLPNPDHKAAEEVYKRAAEIAQRSEEPAEDYLTLAKLYLDGHVGQVNGQTDYKSAWNYFKKVTEVPNVLLKYKKLAFYHMGMLLAKGHIGKQGNTNPSNPAYKEAIEYLTQAGLPESWSILGRLYDKQLGNYEEALKCYMRTGIIGGKLAGLWLLQTGSLDGKFTPIECEQYLKQLLFDINAALPTLSNKEQYYYKGMVNFCMGDWQSALGCLVQALVLGYEKEVWLIKLIEEIFSYLSSYLREKETKGQLQEKPSNEHSVESLPILTKQDIAEQKVASSTEEEQKSFLPAVQRPEEKLITPVLEEVVKAKEPTIEKEVVVEEIITPAKEKLKDKDLAKEETIVERRRRRPEEKTNKWLPLTKEQKKLLQEMRHKKKVSKQLKKEKEEDIQHNQQLPPPVRIAFLNPSVEQEYLRSCQKNEKRLKQIIEDIQRDPYGHGTLGQREVLKHVEGANTTVYSIRIDKENRFVYLLINRGYEILVLVLSSQGHYDNLKNISKYM
jgi:Txe/YoeB family toxin of Txe-Axe toxin-antitoxin module